MTYGAAILYFLARALETYAVVCCKLRGSEYALLQQVLPFFVQMVMQREPVNVVAEVCIVVLAKVGLIKSGALGKDVIDLTLVDLARKGEAVDERRVPQTAGMGQEISDRDLVRNVIFESNARSVFRHRVGKLDLTFLIQHRRCQRRKRLGRGSDVVKRIGIGFYAGFLIRHPVRAKKDRLIVLDHDDRDARKVRKHGNRLTDTSIVGCGEVFFRCGGQRSERKRW